jgi:hypothetical protein
MKRTDLVRMSAPLFILTAMLLDVSPARSNGCDAASHPERLRLRSCAGKGPRSAEREDRRIRITRSAPELLPLKGPTERESGADGPH